MDNSNVIMGSDLMVFIGNKTIGFATSCSLELSGDATDISNKDFGNGWSSSKITNRSWTVSSENMYAEKADMDNTSESFEDLFDAYVNGTELTIKWQPTTNYNAAERVNDKPAAGWTGSGVSYSGKATVTSLSASADNGSAGTFSVTFTGMGAITKTPAA